MSSLKRILCVIVVAVLIVSICGCGGSITRRKMQPCALEGTIYDPNAFREDMLSVLKQFKIDYVSERGQSVGYCKLTPQTMTEKQRQVAYQSFLEKGDYEFGLQLLKDVMPDDIEIDYSTYNGSSFVIRKGYIPDQKKMDNLFFGEMVWTFKEDNAE